MKYNTFRGIWICPKCNSDNYVVIDNLTTFIPKSWSVCLKCDKYTHLQIDEVNEDKIIIKPSNSYENDEYDF